MWALEEIAPGVQRAPLTNAEESYGRVATPARLCACGAPLPPSTRAPRKWCSDNCRKRAWDKEHRIPCIDCGDLLAPRAESKGAERCRPCWKRFVAQGREARIEDAAAMYNDGLPILEIAAALGYGPNSRPPELTWARQRGLLTMTRRTPEQIERIRAGRWGTDVAA